MTSTRIPTEAKATPAPDFTKTIAALNRKDVGEWELGDALVAEVEPSPVGVHTGHDWDALSTRLEAEAIDVSADSLRQYRDAAARWAKTDRVKGVSFTAHRAALSASKNVPTTDGSFAPKVLIERLQKANGRVRVKDVKEAVKPTKTTAQQSAKSYAATAKKLQEALDEVNARMAKWLVKTDVAAVDTLMENLALIAEEFRKAKASAKPVAAKKTPAKTTTKKTDPKAKKTTPKKPLVRKTRTPKTDPKTTTKTEKKTGKGRVRG